ncbi:malto-oligosyltrehalose synthase [Rhodococcus maanshanensis]|uniref:(1->4)-alpha-D-glucan 1-alpha-D-glucosylmutase n=1 Tax=Rhodococcus maanshanensis TaxID=183556 RepID=A0A1H7SWI5_9NOCA|nr:malto-oligosyltrehalose synthase [Rhodococcus maanshanensis]SEL76951.1 (1->4)-alpha-D-glucan 1-alpha-D-glucosylmutase [Rhodococcus maanshanensis]
MTGPAVTATYRLQLRGDAFTLADARELADYLDDLGVSHLYLSPVLTAATGSTHGYDVTDPTSVSPALGGRESLAALASELRGRGMGLIVDLVPNHVGVADPRQNRWWWDVLKHGHGSAYSSYFDIDWAKGRFAVPALGDDEALTIDRAGQEPMLAYYDHRYPIAPGTDGGDAAAVHSRQAYELVDWRSGRVGYRRFFTVNELAALRQEDPAVFEASHREVRTWVSDGLADGVRIDHPDGLTDPTGYLRRLRELLGPDRWLVVEKILAPGEPLDPALPVDGTTGYDALGELTGVFLDPAGERELTDLHLLRTGDRGDAESLRRSERALKREVLRGGLAPEVRRLVGAVRRDAPSDVDPDALTSAVAETVALIPYYRTDYGPTSGALGEAIGVVSGEHPELAGALSALSAAVLAEGEAAARLQQVCGAAMAKAVEDRLFYRTARLICLQEVGGDPGRFGISVAQFHLAQARRARDWPAAMTTLSTHDTKRGEDVRARIGVLSQAAGLWSRSVRAWEELAPSPDPATGLFLWQTMFGVWPVVGVPDSTVRERLHAYATKAARESGVQTSWERVDAAFESRVHAWIDEVIDGPVAASMSDLVRILAPHGRIDSLGQKLLQLAGPGIPDVYQGTELWEDSLVDPDNRRPVDFGVRRRLAADPRPVSAVDAVAKLLVTRAALRLRRERPSSFVGGTYSPVTAEGAAASHLVGFLRGEDVIAVATRHSFTLSEHGWHGTSVALPPGAWTDRLNGHVFTGRVPAEELFGRLPVTLLARA